MPVQAKANGLELDPVPSELSDLSPLELRLISMHIPFMKMVALPRGQQQSIHGPAMNLPTNLISVCDVLPRLPSECQLIPMKLKIKIQYRGHYMYDYVSSEKLMKALIWLKVHNPLYAKVNIIEDWSQQSLLDNSALFHALTSSEDTRVDLHTTPSSAPNDVEVYVDTPALNASSDYEVVASSNVRESEVDARIIQATRMLTELATKRRFSVHNVPADGDCLFSAIALQLESLGIQAVRSKDLRHNLVMQVHGRESSDW